MKENQESVHSSHENTSVIPLRLSELTNISLAGLSGKDSISGDGNEMNVVGIALNSATFSSRSVRSSNVTIINQQDDQLIISCTCGNPAPTLCEHQYQSLHSLLNVQNLRIFFDDTLRHPAIQKIAADYGMEEVANPDEHFILIRQENSVIIKPKNDSILAVSKQSLAVLRQKLANHSSERESPVRPENSSRFLVLKQHKFYRHLYIELIQASCSREGKIKNPFVPFNPLEAIWEQEDPKVIRFFSAISRFQKNIGEKPGAADLPYLKAIINNPLDLAVYMHDSAISENVSAASVRLVGLALLRDNVSFIIKKKGQFYELSGNLNIEGQFLSLENLQIRFNQFLQVKNTLYLVQSAALLTLLSLFKGKGKGKELLIHESRFKDFRDAILQEVENSVNIDHQYLKAATTKQTVKSDFPTEQEKIIYLSDFGQHISIVPVIRYGDIEIPVRSKRQIIAADEKGKEFIVRRDAEEEDRFMALLLRQHPDFEEQLDNPLQYFYLHKKRFLIEDWFLKSFADWEAANITILGFEEITGNKLNPHKAKISIRVTSGLNWFNTDADVRFGKKKATLKQLRQSIRSKSKYVQLDDGTFGMLPAEWIEKFAAWFSEAEIVDDTLRTPRINIASLATLYGKTELSEEVKAELHEYQKRLAEFDEIKEAAVPVTLNATLRPYQQHGLSWLNFLDDFNFGGCLADDMGLGKSVQIIAFILSQREKRGITTNLIVVPTSLVFNWLSELEKFAPSITVFTAYGADRSKNVKEFNRYEVILTTYGTLVSDIGYFKKFSFNYVFFDESQNIKNPQSQRYMAARMLLARSKIVITGTPVENNTFDLYGQLSIACPGLLGNLNYFRDVYSSPIDKFGVKKRASELQKKIEPFILRRTKSQVATELPEKVEMVIYCEMKPEQRRVYDAYEKEFREYIASRSDDELAKSSMYVLKGITKLRQICDSAALAGVEGTALNNSSKIETLLTHIEDQSAGHKILVFSQFVTMLDLIREQLSERKIAFSYLTGKTKDREAVVNEFQDDPEIRVFLISLKTGGTGLNLTEASYVYIVDPWWNPAVENQAIDRCYRIGQKKNVVAVRLICPDTVEEKIMKLQQSKNDRMNDLVRADTTMLKSMSKADLMNLIKHP